MTTTPVPAAMVRGAAELESTERGLRPHRLPGWAREQYPDPRLLTMEAQPSGVRLALAGRATTVEVLCHPTRLAYRGAERPRGRLDLLVDGELLASDPLTGGDRWETDLQTGATEHHPGPPHRTVFRGLPDHDKTMEIWLPHSESVELLELRSDAPVRPAPPARRRWLHHGSSISHGSSAESPSATWPAVAARLAGVELQNLGLGGNALLDPFLARVLRDTPADVISVKLGINVVNVDLMRLRAFVPAVHGFLDTIRDGHPDTPLLVVSPILCPIHEDTPGPGAVDPATLGTDQVRFLATGRPEEVAEGKLTLRVIREELRALVERRADPHLHHLDGTELYGEADAAELPLPDALHPDTATHRLIGERFAAHAFGPGRPLAAPEHAGAQPA
ncbi:lipase [Desertihabitans brevis]|uniref:Lipase n=1 Tax=Desertihabitans brevis TaxID=2268447 RepID=A0A367YYJ2_9ACTN|nr:SGNH/GDSL hydrolase family protein [Desertihabitans brevis]RCK70983.1 lipase [Desertihabitans brevis]